MDIISFGKKSCIGARGGNCTGIWTVAVSCRSIGTVVSVDIGIVSIPQGWCRLLLLLSFHDTTTATTTVDWIISISR